MDKGLLFLTLSLVCFWLIFDDFFGKKRLSAFATQVTPNSPSIGAQLQQGAKEAATNPAAQQAIVNGAASGANIVIPGAGSIVQNLTPQNIQAAGQAVSNGSNVIGNAIDNAAAIAGFNWKPSQWVSSLWGNIWGGK